MNNEPVSSQSNQPAVPLPDPRVRPTIPALHAFSLLGLNRTTGYKAIKENRFPVPIIKVGRVLLVPTAAMMRLLEQEPRAAEELPAVPNPAEDDQIMTA